MGTPIRLFYDHDVSFLHVFDTTSYPSSHPLHFLDRNRSPLRNKFTDATRPDIATLLCRAHCSVSVGSPFIRRKME